MKLHPVLSRRGAFGLAAMLTLVRPAPAGGIQASGRLVPGELLRMETTHGIGEGICMDACGLEPIRATLRVEGEPGGLDAAGDRLRGTPAPWGWDTLENVR